MSEASKESSVNQPLNYNFSKVECPYCRISASISLDPKQTSDKKSLHLCLICGQVFEYINPAG